jgi:hypothetical protein
MLGFLLDGEFMLGLLLNGFCVLLLSAAESFWYLCDSARVDLRVLEGYTPKRNNHVDAFPIEEESSRPPLLYAFEHLPPRSVLDKTVQIAKHQVDAGREARISSLMLLDCVI